MRVTEVNLISQRGYLMELQPICEDHHDRTDPEKAALFLHTPVDPWVCVQWASVPGLDHVYHCPGVCD